MPLTSEKTFAKNAIASGVPESAAKDLARGMRAALEAREAARIIRTVNCEHCHTRQETEVYPVEHSKDRSWEGVFECQECGLDSSVTVALRAGEPDPA